MFQKFVLSFENIPSLYRALILAGGLALFWLTESALPLSTIKYNKWRHAGVNIFFTLTTIIVNFAFAVLIVLASRWSISHSFGILQWIALPFWTELLVGLMVLDLVGAYLIHLVQHKIKWMWRFHMIHHADTNVDTTTANRHHPVESVFRAVFTLLAVVGTGSPMWLVMLYQSLSVLLSQFNHANIRLPRWLDRLISFIIVSPDMHKVHHHFKRPETDSNYGNIFPFWDWIFGTFRTVKANDIHYGLDVLEGTNNNSIAGQLKMPFNKGVKSTMQEL
ncbi:MAG TPA: sterol desaturase family protein [Chitinophagaceae bacterium]|nr:sterol desaturase family protein [Chitinophagaceae bacterium]